MGINSQAACILTRINEGKEVSLISYTGQYNLDKIVLAYSAFHILIHQKTGTNNKDIIKNI